MCYISNLLDQGKRLKERNGLLRGTKEHTHSPWPGREGAREPVQVGSREWKASKRTSKTQRQASKQCCEESTGPRPAAAATAVHASLLTAARSWPLLAVSRASQRARRVMYGGCFRFVRITGTAENKGDLTTSLTCHAPMGAAEEMRSPQDVGAYSCYSFSVLPRTKITS